jgi:HEAT repeat protein
MLKHHLVRPGFSVPHEADEPYRTFAAKDPESALWERQCFAAEEMAKLGREVLPIVTEALHDEDEDVHIMAIRACGDFHDPAAIEPLVKRMIDERADSGSGIQLACMCALVEIGPVAYRPLLEACKEPRFSDVRREVPAEMAIVGKLAAVPQIIELLEDSAWQVRANAACELGELKDKRATEALVRHLSGPDLNPQEHNSDRDIRWYAAKSLGEIGDREAIPSLLRTFKDARLENDVRISAAGALARMGRDEGLPFLLAMVKSHSPNDRADAAEALGTNQIKGTVDPLLSLLSDSKPEVRRQASRAVRNLRDPRTIPAVRKLLNDPDPDVRNWAGETLVNFGVKLPSASQPGKP